MILVNNLTTAIDAAYQTLITMYNDERSSKYVKRLLDAFSKNTFSVRGGKNRCGITNKQSVSMRELQTLSESQKSLFEKISYFMLNTQPSKDEQVLAFTQKSGWSSYDTSYTMQFFGSPYSDKVLSRQGLFALNKLRKELEEAKKEAAEDVSIANGRTTETVNIFELEVKPKTTKSKKAVTVKEELLHESSN